MTVLNMLMEAALITKNFITWFAFELNISMRCMMFVQLEGIPKIFNAIMTSEMIKKLVINRILKANK